MHEEQPGRAEPADEVPVRIVLVDDHAIEVLDHRVARLQAEDAKCVDA